MVQQLRKIRPLGQATRSTALELDRLRRHRTEIGGVSHSIRELSVRVGDLTISQQDASSQLGTLVDRLDRARTNNSERLALLREALRTNQGYQSQVDAAVETSAGFTTQVQTIVLDQDVLGTAIRNAISEREPTIRDVIVEVVRDELDIPEEETLPGETTMFTQTVTQLLTPAEVTRRVNAAVAELVARRQTEINARVNASIRRAVAAQVVVPEGTPPSDAAVAVIAGAAARDETLTQIAALRSRITLEITRVRNGRTNHLANTRTNLIGYNTGFYRNLQNTGLEQRWQKIYDDGTDLLNDFFGGLNDYLRQLNVFLLAQQNFASQLRAVATQYELLEDIPIFHPELGFSNNIGNLVRGAILVSVSPAIRFVTDLIATLQLVGFASVLFVGIGLAYSFLPAPTLLAQGVGGAFFAGIEISYTGTVLTTGLTTGFGFTSGGVTAIGAGIQGVGSVLVTANTVAAVLGAAGTVVTTLGATGGIARAFGVASDPQEVNANLERIYGTSDLVAIARQAGTRTPGYQFTVISGENPLGGRPTSFRRYISFWQTNQPANFQYEYD